MPISCCLHRSLIKFELTLLFPQGSLSFQKSMKFFLRNSWFQICLSFIQQFDWLDLTILKIWILVIIRLQKIQKNSKLSAQFLAFHSNKWFQCSTYFTPQFVYAFWMDFDLLIFKCKYGNDKCFHLKKQDH